MREVLSTARPTPLRFAGFLAIVLGAAAAAFGTTRDWAVIGFPQDRTGAADVVFRGIDVWEGKTVLLVAVAALIAMIPLRLVQVAGTRKLIATLLIAFGLLAGALPLPDAVRATERFGGGEGLDRMVAGLAAELELPEDVVRAELRDRFGESLRVELAFGLWLSAAGGLVLALGGGLGLLWASRTRIPAAPPGS